MNIFKAARKPSAKLFLAVLFVGTQCVKYVKGSYLIDDYRVRSLDVSPALGRGYSIKTNQFHSICLDVEETTEPSYNYDYSYTDMSGTSSSETSSSVSSKVKGSFGYAWVKGNMSRQSDTKSTTTSKSEYHTIMTTMRIERYYSSVKENNAELSEDAKELLAAKDYVGFYKSCGPNYVRSIRRAQEVTAMFSFTSTDSTATRKMKSTIEAAVNGGSRFKVDAGRTSKSDSKSRKTEQSLRIKIVGYGLGLDKDGSETLVATSLDEFNNVMKFAFSSMTRGNQGSAQTGMVYGIEVVPWSANTAFQVGSKVFDAEEAIGDEGGLPKYILPFDSIADASCPEEKDDDNKCCTFSNLDIRCVGTDSTAAVPAVTCPTDPAKKKEFQEVEDSSGTTKLCCKKDTKVTRKCEPLSTCDEDDKICSVDLQTCDDPVPATDKKMENGMCCEITKLDCPPPPPGSICTANQEADKNGKCCGMDDMIFTCSQGLKVDCDGNNQELSDSDMCCAEAYTEKECVPEREYPLEFLKRNLDSNGELVAEMDFVYRKKLLNIMNLDGCITQLRSLPQAEDHTYLQGQDAVKDDSRKEDKNMSVRRLRAILDPDKNGTGLKILNWELEEWMDKFYMPCLNALYGLSAGGTGSTADAYFMTKPWQEHDACRNPTCLIPHYRWDRERGSGCTTSFGMLGGGTTELDEPPPMEGNECGKTQGTSGEAAPVCRHTNEKWNKALKAMGKCWGASAPISLMEKYCYPRLTDFSEPKKDSETKLCNEEDN